MMSSSEQITQLIVLHVKDGVDLGNVAASNTSPSVQAFISSSNTVKAQPGFVRQYWGHEVEHPHIFVWVVDWESFEQHMNFATSEVHASFIAGLSSLFELENSPLVTLYTRVTDKEGATAAFASPVTEVAFYTMPTRPDDATKAEIEEGSKAVLKDVQEIGKASGAAIGWVFEAFPQTLVSGENSVVIYGAFGYASIDVHMAWRETPEGKKHGEPSKTILPATVVPGIDQSTGYFHVHFQEGV